MICSKNISLNFFFINYKKRVKKKSLRIFNLSFMQALYHNVVYSVYHGWVKLWPAKGFHAARQCLVTLFGERIYHTWCLKPTIDVVLSSHRIKLLIYPRRINENFEITEELFYEVSQRHCYWKRFV